MCWTGNTLTFQPIISYESFSTFIGLYFVAQFYFNAVYRPSAHICGTIIILYYSYYKRICIEDFELSKMRPTKSASLYDRSWSQCGDWNYWECETSCFIYFFFHIHSVGSVCHRSGYYGLIYHFSIYIFICHTIHHILYKYYIHMLY